MFVRAGPMSGGPASARLCPNGAVRRRPLQ